MSEISIYIDLDGGYEVDLPQVFELCPRCKGAGKHVNPAIDGDGISGQEFHEDPDFAESYFGGVYDVTCERCRGERVIGVPDLTSLSPAERAAYERALDDERRDLEQWQAEIARGA